MCDSPRRRNRTGKTYGKQKSNLTLFGQWIEYLNFLLGVNQAEMAARIGLSKSTLSKNTRGKSDMKRETVLKLIHTYEELATEKQIMLPEYWQHRLFLSWSNDETLIGEARAMLEKLERREEV